MEPSVIDVDSELESREMAFYEVGMIVDYFHSQAPEDLDRLGVDPTRLPDPAVWTELLRAECERAVENRLIFPVAWYADDLAVGFSTVDKIEFGELAHMHAHLMEPTLRRRGLGTAYVRQTAWLCFELLRVKRIVCEPHALNVAANRTLQRAGFRYEATHWTVPGALSFRQPVTRWVAERGVFGAA